MAKDPAVLFYTNDFLTGTFTMTNEQVGKYIRLLCLQHQKGKLTEKDMLHVCGTYDEDVFLKFKKIGNYYSNERLSEEAEKRNNFCESRRLSRQGTGNKQVIKKRTSNVRKSYVKHMENEIENEIEDINVLWSENKKQFFNAFEFKEKICRDKNKMMIDVEKAMNEYISDQELKEDLKPFKELKSHFINWFNLKLKNGTNERINDQKPGTSDARVAALKNWSIGGKIYSGTQ